MKRISTFKAGLLLCAIILSLTHISCKKSAKEANKALEHLRLKPTLKEPPMETIFQNNIKNIQIAELGSDNISIWAKNGIRDRKLVLIDSRFNLLRQIPDELLLEAKGLIEKGDYETLAQHTSTSEKFKQFYDSFDYVFAAHRLGLIKEVIWVIPVSESINFDYRDFFKMRLQEDRAYNFPKEDIESFTFQENKLTGHLLGIPITVVTLEDLVPPAEPVLLTINISYLTSFITDNVRTPIEDISVAFLKSLSKKSLVVNYVTIINSNTSFDVSLQFRFLSNIFHDILRDPALIRNPKNEWILKQYGDEKLAFLEYDSAERDYLKILETTPDDPAIYFQLAFVQVKRSKFDEAVEYIEKAIKLDPEYILSYISMTKKMLSEKKKLQFTKLGLEKHPDNFYINLTLAQKYYESGDFEESLKYFKKLIALGIESYDFSFMIADCYFNIKEYDKSISIYNNTFSLLPELYKPSFASYYVSLSDAYISINDYRNAVKYLNVYLDYNQDPTTEDTIRHQIKRLEKRIK